MSTILIENGLVVLAPNCFIDGTDILVEGRNIEAIGPKLRSRIDPARTTIIDASRRIVMPGFVNAHVHSNEAFEQGCYDNLPLETWIAYSYPPFDNPKMPARVHYLRAMSCAIQTIRSGVTTLQDDVCNLFATEDVTDAVVSAYREIGLRAAVTISMWNQPLLDAQPFLRELMPQDIQERLNARPRIPSSVFVDLFTEQHRKWNGEAGRIRILPAPLSPHRCTTDLLLAAGDLAERYDTPLHIHCLETKVHAVIGDEFYGKPVVRHLDELALLSRRTTLNHAIWLTQPEIEILGTRGCSTTHLPLSNMKLGSGVSPVRALMHAGVNVALGTDGLATSDTPDMVDSIRAASLLHKIGGNRWEEWLGASDAFVMATQNGAKSVMWENEIGSLEAGKKADIILLDRYGWGFIPLHDPIRQLAFSASSESVMTSIIDGEIVMHDRKILMVNEDAIRQELSEVAERFRRDHLPVMHRGAAHVIPALEKMLERSEAYRLRSNAEIMPARRPPLTG